MFSGVFYSKFKGREAMEAKPAVCGNSMPLGSIPFFTSLASASPFGHVWFCVPLGNPRVPFSRAWLMLPG